MKKLRLLTLALAGALFVPTLQAQFANAVIAYDPGNGFAAGFTNVNAALGAPTASGSVTPFAPPFSKNQILSVGAGGEITLQLNSPILNNPANPYGIDFILFANEFFIGSGGTANGLFFHAATTLVQVSLDDATWYTLDPLLAPPAGLLFPTDGIGNPQIPVNPTLTSDDFNGQNLAGIRSLYAGSAGGTGYDLAWAEDANNNPVDITGANYIRIEVTSGVLDLDAISVVPEPATWVLTLAGASLLWLRLRNR